MAEQHDVITWGAVGVAVLSWAPRFFSWTGSLIEGNRTVKVKENEKFQDFLMSEFNGLKAAVSQLRLELDDCQNKHADAERRVIELSGKLDLLASQHAQLLK
jgi:hypothetical protein